MPATGGHAQVQQARRRVQRQNPRVRRSAQTAGHQGRALQDKHGTQFQSVSFLKQRGHRPGGVDDPRYAAGGQRWSGATHTTGGYAQGGYAPVGSAWAPHSRWWEQDQGAPVMSTDITQTEAANKRSPYMGWSESYIRRQNERWGTGNWEQLLTDPRQLVNNPYWGGTPGRGTQEGGGSSGAGFF